MPTDQYILIKEHKKRQDMELLTISKAAKKLGIHPNSLRNWEKRGLIKPVRLPEGQRKYSMDELDRLLQSGRLTVD